jgi:hypothetical protein
MMERVDSRCFTAMSEALSKVELNTLYDEVHSGKPLSEKSNQIVANVNQMVNVVNGDILKYEVDIDKPKVVIFDTLEGSGTNKRSDHVIHIGNILQTPIVKLTAILIVSSRDDVQGGELAFKHWPDHPRVDNYGKVVRSDDGHHQPAFTNEQGTLIVYPSTEEVGSNLTTSGRVKRIKFIYSGRRFR